MSENQIVVYQPNEAVRLDVRLENETVWLTQSQMGELFGCTTRNVRLHLENIYSCGELTQGATRKDFFLVRQEGDRQVKRNVTCYNLDAIISVGYRVNSVLGVRFRQWATQVLKEFMLHGYAFNHRLNELEDKMDRRLAKHDQDIVDLKDNVDFFVQTSQPPVRGVFYNGQVFDAHVFAAKFNTQHGALTITVSKNFHDRFLVIDDKTLYLVGASLKDLGWKCFAFTKLNSTEILRLKARV